MHVVTVPEFNATFEVVLDRVVDDGAPIGVVRPEGQRVLLVPGGMWDAVQRTLSDLSLSADEG